MDRIRGTLQVREKGGQMLRGLGPGIGVEAEKVTMMLYCKPNDNANE